MLIITKIFYFYNTIKFLKFGQIYWRIKYKIIRRKTIAAKLNVDFDYRGNFLNTVVPFIPSAVSYLGEFRFNFLNIEYSPQSWNDKNIQKLWCYNLHYFDFVNQENFINIDIIDSWINNNAMGCGNGWEPYPLSLRIVNLIKYELKTSKLSRAHLESLHDQSFLLLENIEYHILGNHLFENGKALILAGIFFDNVTLYKKGSLIISVEIENQVLMDGAHFELSPMYHSIILEGLLDIVNFHKSFSREYPSRWDTVIQKMINYLKAVIHPDGEIVCFNDSTFGIAKLPAEIFTYAKNLGYFTKVGVLSHYINSGLVRCNRGEHQLYIDAGAIGPDYLPGHAHADNLTFELSLFGKRVIVDTGISTYERNDRRLVERSTSAHNTVLIDKKNQSEIWSSFRVAKRVYPESVTVNSSESTFNFTGSYTGKKHTRRVSWHKNEIRIQDDVCDITEIAELFLHFHPSVKVTKNLNNIEGRICGRLIFQLEILSASLSCLEFYKYCYGFNSLESATCLKLSFEGNGNHSFDILLRIL